MPLISQFHNHAQNVQAVVLAGHTRPVNSTDCMIEGKYYLKRIIIDIFILYFKKIFPLIYTIRRVYGTCGPPKQRLVRSAHDCETV